MLCLKSKNKIDSSVQNCYTLKFNELPKNNLFFIKKKPNQQHRTELTLIASYRNSLEMSILLVCGINIFSLDSLNYDKF